MTRKLVLVALVSAALAGCTGSAYMTTSSRATVVAHTPDLVYVSPGVQVIADYDEPVFYADGYYWRYYDDTWYRSGYYTGGWSYVERPPTVIARIGSPYRYERYRPSGYVVRNRPVPAHRLQQPPPVRSRAKSRDHRDVPAYEDRNDRGRDHDRRRGRDRGRHRGHR